MVHNKNLHLQQRVPSTSTSSNTIRENSANNIPLLGQNAYAECRQNCLRKLTGQHDVICPLHPDRVRPQIRAHASGSRIHQGDRHVVDTTGQTILSLLTGSDFEELLVLFPEGKDKN